MKRIIPDDILKNLPCSNVAISCALGKYLKLPTTRKDGYMTLKDNNKYIRDYLDVKRYKYFKKAERPKLTDLSLNKAIVCVYGHYIYLEKDHYWSFFDNTNDLVVAYWELE